MLKRALIVFVTLILFVPVFVGCRAAAPTAEIIILHTNDMHGRVVGNDESIIGLDWVAAIHAGLPNSILVDAGDALHGLPVATLNRGADIARLMEAAGYDAMATGNHEFNYGWERLIELRDIAGFPFLVSNASRGGSDFLDDTIILEIEGVKIGLFGLITEATAHSAMPAFVNAIDFADPVQTAREKVEYLQKQKVHLIVALCHLGDTQYDGTLSTTLAEKVPEIDIIIDGHSHSESERGQVINGVLIVQTGDHGRNLGWVQVNIENGVVTDKTASLLSFEEARNQTSAPDTDVTAMIDSITAGMETILNEPIGESLVDMSSERSPGLRTQEMPLGNLVADSYRTASDADIAIANGGAIRADISTGTITKGDVISVLPFGNTLMVKSITPAVLFEVLENGVSGIVLDDDFEIDYELSAQGRFPQVSGFTFVYDPSAPVGVRVVSITLDDGRELSPDDNTTAISLASIDFIMTGGDQYIVLDGIPVLRELGAADEALTEYIKAHSPIEAPASGRIKTLAESLGSGQSDSVQALTLYTSMKESLILTLADDFMSKNPNITVDTKIAGAGTLMAEIDAEHEQGAVNADVIWTSEIPDFYYMKDKGWLLQYTPPIRDSTGAVLGMPGILDLLGGHDGYFAAARLGTMGIAYNTDLIDSPPESWQDLTGAAFKDGFAIADPTTSGTALMSIVLLNEEFGENLFTDLRKNGAFIGQGSSQVIEAVANGELAACLAVDYITYDKVDSGAPIALAYPHEMLVIPSPVAIFKDSPNADAAKKFVDYLVTTEAQQIIATIGTLPVYPDIVPLTDLYRGIPSFTDAMERAIIMNFADMMNWKGDIIDRFMEIMK